MDVLNRTQSWGNSSVLSESFAADVFISSVELQCRSVCLTSLFPGSRAAEQKAQIISGTFVTRVCICRDRRYVLIDFTVLSVTDVAVSKSRMSVEVVRIRKEALTT
jgi:hypothetical protein